MTGYHVDLPHNDCGVFGASCQFCAIVGELAEPDFIAVFCENLLCVAGELFPLHTHTRTHTNQKHEQTHWFAKHASDLCIKETYR